MESQYIYENKSMDIQISAHDAAKGRMHNAAQIKHN